MKRLAIFMLLIAATVAHASDYIYRDGYYWSGDRAYTRTLYQDPGYWRCGLYYPGASHYRYAEVAVYNRPALVVNRTVSYQDPGWRSKLLDIAAGRDKVEGEIRKAAFDQQYYMEAVKALGLEGNFRWQGYGFSPFGDTPSAVMPYAAVQGKTDYGYTYNALGKVWGDNELPQLWQMANQHVQGSQQLAGAGQAGFQALVTQEGSNRARVADILAKSEIASKVIENTRMGNQILAALAAGPEVKGYAFQITSSAKVQRTEANVDPAVKQDLSAQFRTVATQLCASCHSGETKKGKFDIATYPTLTPEQKEVVWERLITPDDKRVMPQPQPGEQVKRIPAAVFRLFILN